jgi:tetratricopeptide (TPR) repeat protein
VGLLHRRTDRAKACHQSAPVLIDRAQVLRRLGRYPAALADFDRARQRSPALPGGREQKAVTLALAGQHDAALAEFAAAGGEPSGRADVWTAAIAWHRGEADRADRLFERADGKPLGPSSWEAANLRAVVSCALGRAGAADQLTAAAGAAEPSVQDVVDGLYDLLGDPPLVGIGALRAIADRG